MMLLESLEFDFSQTAQATGREIASTTVRTGSWTRPIKQLGARRDRIEFQAPPPRR
jgi:hypothetical protein